MEVPDSSCPGREAGPTLQRASNRQSSKGAVVLHAKTWPRAPTVACVLVAAPAAAFTLVSAGSTTGSHREGAGTVSLGACEGAAWRWGRSWKMIIQAGNAVAAWIYLWMTFQLGFYESTDLLPRVSMPSWPGCIEGWLR